ncbi:MAG: Hsp20/alpha crystallin family protein [Verrucomicrobia bacterium]|nr:Hsp20/alpha crystallin family protein [Verrucomicrobiota bacterium]
MTMCKVSSSLHFVKTHSQSVQESSGETYWVPNTDVYVCDDGLVIKVELAGMRREDLELVVDSNRVKITGHRPDGCRAGKCKFLVMEINYGAFETVIELPKGYDLSQARAAYQNGFLRIDVPVQGGNAQQRTSDAVTSTAK